RPDGFGSRFTSLATDGSTLVLACSLTYRTPYTPHGTRPQWQSCKLLSEGYVLIPFAVDGYGGLGPMARRLLFGDRPRRALTFRPDRPNATRMYARASNPPAPHAVVTLASIRWKQNQTRAFYGHSYTAPTPHEHLLQQLGLCFTKAFAIHIRNSYQKLMRRHSHTHSLSHNHAPAATDTS
ncbi:hypothetical protein THAOC_13109, partial [Thalassiosira oceanica]